MSIIFKIIGASFLFQFLLSVILAARKDVAKMIAQKAETQESKPANQVIHKSFVV